MNNAAFTFSRSYRGRVQAVVQGHGAGDQVADDGDLQGARDARGTDGRQAVRR